MIIIILVCYTVVNCHFGSSCNCDFKLIKIPERNISYNLGDLKDAIHLSQMVVIMTFVL